MQRKDFEKLVKKAILGLPEHIQQKIRDNDSANSYRLSRYRKLADIRDARISLLHEKMPRQPD